MINSSRIETIMSIHPHASLHCVIIIQSCDLKVHDFVVVVAALLFVLVEGWVLSHVRRNVV